MTRNSSKTVLAPLLCLALTGMAIGLAWPQAGAPGSVVAEDDPEDKAGTTLMVRWEAPSEMERPAGKELVGYQILVAEHVEGQTRAYEPKAETAPDAVETPVDGLKPGREYRVRVAALFAPPGVPWYAPGGEPEQPGPDQVEATAAPSDPVGPVRPVGLWFDTSKVNVLVGVIVYCVVVILCFLYSRRREMYVRPIAGLQAVNDAIGRATEMGKPILFVSGLGSVGDISTIASMLVLGHLAKRTAAYETDILVPCYDPLVMTAEREIVREAYTEAGRPQNFKPDNIFYVTDSQFGYVAAVDGIMVREKPAANFYMGYFYAESLILAETGNMTGAVQIAGTDADTQIPFFITTCDYTLMGEELYAAGAYLSRHPTLLAQLKGQDIGKVILTALLVIGAIAATLGSFGLSDLAQTIVGWFAT